MQAKPLHKKKKTLRPKKVSLPFRLPVTRTEVIPSQPDLFLFQALSATMRIAKVLLIFVSGFVVALAFITSIVGTFYLRSVTAQSGMSREKLYSLVLESQHRQVAQTDGRKNILLLGLDSLSNRDSSTVLTDTIMVVSLEVKSGEVTTFSFPRDLYIASQSAKLNALYQLGLNKKLAKPDALIVGTIEGMTGIPIHHTLFLDISTVVSLIDALGGLTIDVQRSFVDFKFPRTDVDVRVVKDPNRLYETVAFTQGKEHMSGDRALRFIRSRHSLDPVEGSDEGRVKRQQQVILALIERLKDPSLLTNPDEVGKLLKVYDTYIEKTLPLIELAATGNSMLRSGATPSFQSMQFPIVPQDANGVFYHPIRFYTGAWVYLPVDPTYNQVRNQVKAWLD